MIRHLRIFDFAIAALVRSPAKTLVTITVYSVLVAAVVSLMLYVKACRREAHGLLAEAPDIVVQTIRGGRHNLTPSARADTIRDIRGVGAVKPRVWGYSFDPPSGATFTVWGAESVPMDAFEFTDEALAEHGIEGGCAVGSGLADHRFLGIGDRLPLRRWDGTLYAPRVLGIFESSSALLTNDLVVIPTEKVRRLFGIEPDLATDIAVEVYNPYETATVAGKILEIFPDARTITKSQILQTYDAVFDWRGGMWAAILLSCISAFAILVWDKGTGVTEREYRNVGLLKATGWRSRDIMELKLFEGAAVSSVSLTAGFVLAQIHLLWFDGFVFSRTLKGWSVLYPSFPVHAALDLPTALFCLAMVAVPYAAANVIPAWRISITDPDIVLRS